MWTYDCLYGQAETAYQFLKGAREVGLAHEKVWMRINSPGSRLTFLQQAWRNVHFIAQ